MLAGGLTFLAFGDGPPLVVLPGLGEHAGIARREARAHWAMHGHLATDFTVHVVNHREGLPAGTTIADVAGDCAAAISGTFGAPVAVVGVSTGGSVAQQLAIDHPQVVRRLVLVATACRLSDTGRALQRRYGDLLASGRRRRASALMGPALASSRAGGRAMAVLLWLLAPWVTADAPPDVRALIAAEDAFDVCDQLGRIRVPTLVVGGGRDAFYGAGLFRRTATGVPGAQLLVKPGLGHGAVLFDGEVRRTIRRFLAAEQGPGNVPTDRRSGGDLDRRP
jgi:pimeloyl-ACP methyl ester carboxylesterase